VVGWYFRNRRAIDVGIALFGVALHLIARKIPGSIFLTLSDADLKGLDATIFSTATSLLGFVLAAGTFLIAHVKGAEFGILRRSKSFRELPKLIASAIWRLFGLALASGLSLLTGPALHPFALIMLAFTTIWSALSLAALTWIVMRILAVPTSD
jgi:hypothetical protein